jgi:TolA-binding protein
MMRTISLACMATALLAAAVIAQEKELTPYQKGTEAWRAAEQLRTQDPAQALPAYEKFIAEFPHHPYASTAVLRMGDFYRSQKQADKAIAAYDRLVKEYPNALSDKLGALFNKAAVLVNDVKDYKAGADIYARLGTEYPGYTNAEACLYSVIDAYWRVPDYAACVKAVDAYLAAGVSQGARALQALDIQARCYVNLGDMVAMQAALDQIAKRSEGAYMLGLAQRNVAGVLNQKQKSDEAAAQYLAASKVTCTGSAAADLYAGAGLLAQAKKYEEAVAAYREYLNRFPQGYYAQYALLQIAGISGNYLKDPAKQAAAYKELLATYPNSIYADQAYCGMGNAYRIMKNTEEAKAAFKTVYEKMPTSSLADAALWMQADILRSEKDNEGARALYEKIIADYPGGSYVSGAEQRLQAMH